MYFLLMFYIRSFLPTPVGTFNVLLLQSSREDSRVMHSDTSGTTYLAVGMADFRVHLLDSHSGVRCMPAFSGHTGTIKAIDVEASTRRFVTASYDTTVRLWTMDSRRVLKIFKGSRPYIFIHIHPVSCVCRSYRDRLMRVFERQFCRLRWQG